jgi:hypothetical protein
MSKAFVSAYVYELSYNRILIKKADEKQRFPHTNTYKSMNKRETKTSLITTEKSKSVATRDFIYNRSRG